MLKAVSVKDTPTMLTVVNVAEVVVASWKPEQIKVVLPYTLQKQAGAAENLLAAKLMV